MTDKPSLGYHLEIPQDRLYVGWTKPSPSTPLRVTRGQTTCMTDMPSPAHLSEYQRTDYLTRQTSLPLAIILSAKCMCGTWFTIWSAWLRTLPHILLPELGPLTCMMEYDQNYLIMWLGARFSEFFQCRSWGSLNSVVKFLHIRSTHFSTGSCPSHSSPTHTSHSPHSTKQCGC